MNIKPSFFDDTAPSEYSIWKKDVPPKKASELRITQGILFKKSSRTNFWKSRFYVLFEDRLAYYKNSRQPQEHAYCSVLNMRVEKVSIDNEKDQIFGLRIIHNNSFCELFARSRDVQEKWIECLSRFCVLNCYASCFVNIKVIGKGSFARVFLAQRRNNGMNLAVKTFDKSLLTSSTEKARASLINEINVMRRLEHSNIIQLYEVHESDKHIYLVLELLQGGELLDRIMRKGQYHERDASLLMKNLLSALDYMHSKGIMHRDIKPENLILKDSQNDSEIKIADFGLATFINSNDQLFKRCGTPGYVAPEILEDEKYDEKVDIFSSGVILYILLTGGSPFHAQDYNQILLKNKNCDINYNFEQYGLEISELATDLMKKMLSKDPKTRISASDALNHPWILAGELYQTHLPDFSACLELTQENLKRFQDERENVKINRPGSFDTSNLERANHAPSPLINGRMVTITDSRNHFSINSPDFRKSIGMEHHAKGTQSNSPQELSLASTKDDISDQGPVAEEINLLNLNLTGYSTDQTLMSYFTTGAKPVISSSPSVLMTEKAMQPNFNKYNKKVLDIQGALLKYIQKSPATTIATTFHESH